MEIVKETLTKVMTTDGREINVGDRVVFNADNKCFIGDYIGITKRGAVSFKGVIDSSDVTFNVMPKSIKEIYIVSAQLMMESEESNGEV